MNDEITNESQEPVETPSEAPAPSLDDIANEFSVEKEADNFQAQPAPQAPAYQPNYQPDVYQQNTLQPDQFNNIPDPTYDPDGYNRYMQQQATQSQQTTQMLQSIADKINGYEQQMAQQQIERDLGNAVNRVNQKLNVEPDLAETALEIEYRKNPAFQKIWNNRASNPQAFERALDVIADKWSGKFATRTNDQLVENVRAAKQSQQTLATAPKADPNGDVPSDPAEFARWWEMKKQG